MNGATFMMLAHEPDAKSKRDLAKDCDCLLVCDGSLAHERGRIRRRSLGTNVWEQAKFLAAQWLRWGRFAGPLASVQEADNETSVEYAISRFMKSKGPEGENIDDSTLRKYDVLLNDRLAPWCAKHGVTSVKHFENKTACEDFVFSWRNLNPTRNL